MKIKNQTQKTRIFNRSDYLLGIGVLLISFIFYLKTLAPTILWGDPAKLTYYAYLGHLRAYASHHPLRVLLGNWWGRLPFEDYAYGQNLLSAVFASLTIFLTYWIARQLTASRRAAFTTALVLAVSHVFWWLAVVAESYSLSIFFFALIIALLLKWMENGDNWLLYLASFLVGLGLSNHFFLAVFIPAFAYLPIALRRRQVLKIRPLGLVFLCFAMGNLFLLYLMIRDNMFTLSNFDPTTSYSFLGLIIGPRWFFLHHPLQTLQDMLKYPAYLMYQFPLWGFVLGLIGSWKLRKLDRRIFWFVMIACFLDVLVASGYIRTRQWELLLPSFLLFSVLIGLGLDSVLAYLQQLQREKQSVSQSSKMPAWMARYAMHFILTGLLIVTPLVLYYSCPVVFKAFQIDLLRARSLPYRDNNRYFLLPDKSSYWGAAHFAKDVFHTVGYGSIVFADFTPQVVLTFVQASKNLRPDVKIISVDGATPASLLDLDFVNYNVDIHPLYVVDVDDYQEIYRLPELKLKYDIVPQGIVYRIEKRAP